MDGMPEHLFEQNAKVDNQVYSGSGKKFEMINFKHKAQMREKIGELSNESEEPAQEQGSYLSKLNSLAEKWDGSIDEKMPIFVRFNSSNLVNQDQSL